MDLEIDLWMWPLDQDTGRDADCAARLSPDEAARAARFVHAAHARRYRAGRGRMREILAGYSGVDPAALVFDYNPQGKPGLADGPAFNLSHAAGWAALVVSVAPVALGVDIEALRPVEDAVARRFFSNRENAALSRLTPDCWPDGFFRCWTRKEAFIKACGPGLSMPLDSFDVTLTPDTPARLERISGRSSAPADWSLHHLDLGPRLLGAIAVKNRGRPVRIVSKSKDTPSLITPA